MAGFLGQVIISFIAGYPHVGWRRLAVVLSPTAAVYVFFSWDDRWDNGEAFVMAIMALFFTSPLLLIGRDLVNWVSHGFSEEEISKPNYSSDQFLGLYRQCCKHGIYVYAGLKDGNRRVIAITAFIIVALIASLLILSQPRHLSELEQRQVEAEAASYFGETAVNTNNDYAKNNPEMQAPTSVDKAYRPAEKTPEPTVVVSNKHVEEVPNNTTSASGLSIFNKVWTLLPIPLLIGFIIWLNRSFRRDARQSNALFLSGGLEVESQLRLTGWLKFLIQFWFVVRVIFGGILLFNDASKTDGLASEALMGVQASSWVIFAISAIVSLDAARRLQNNREPASVSFAIRALWICGPLTQMLMGAAAIIIAHGSEVVDWGKIVGNTLSSAFLAGIWTLYLTQSKQVRLVYYGQGVPLETATPEPDKGSASAPAQKTDWDEMV